MEALAPLLLAGAIGLFSVGFIALVIALIVYSVRCAAQRRAGLASFAQAREWEFHPEAPHLESRFDGAPFGRGTSRRALNALVGRYDGRDFTAFDYHYDTGAGDNDGTSRHSVIALSLGVRAPDLAVGPTTTMGRWLNNLTGNDVEVGDPAFDEHFTVHTPAPEFARDVLLSDVRDVLRQHPTLAWRITGDSLLVIRSGSHSPETIDATLHTMDALLDRIPPHVWERLDPR